MIPQVKMIPKSGKWNPKTEIFPNLYLDSKIPPKYNPYNILQRRTSDRSCDEESNFDSTGRSKSPGEVNYRWINSGTDNWDPEKNALNRIKIEMLNYVSRGKI